MSIARRLALLPLGLSLVAPMAHAQDAVAGFSQSLELDLVSDYVFRGVSNSDETAAVQPSYTANWTTHAGAVWSLGIWASTLDQDAAIDHEVDWWGGVTWSNRLGDFSAAFTWYSYPGSPKDTGASFGEAQVTAGHALGPVYLTGEYDYSNDYYGLAGPSHYVNANLATGEDVLPGGLVLSGHVGHQWFDDNAAYGSPDYTDGGLRLERSFSWLKAGLEWTTTDLDSAECFGGLAICGDRVFVTLAASVAP
jgi:uncharacterized protein (TIGR02001 family)